MEGWLYLARYGVLQCLYVQQYAVESMVRALPLLAKVNLKIEEEPEAIEV
jgi:hypothetical protein